MRTNRVYRVNRTLCGLYSSRFLLCTNSKSNLDFKNIAVSQCLDVGSMSHVCQGTLLAKSGTWRASSTTGVQQKAARVWQGGARKRPFHALLLQGQHLTPTSLFCLFLSLWHADKGTFSSPNL